MIEEKELKRGPRRDREERERSQHTGTIPKSSKSRGHHEHRRGLTMY